MIGIQFQSAAGLTRVGETALAERNMRCQQLGACFHQGRHRRHEERPPRNSIWRARHRRRSSPSPRKRVMTSAMRNSSRSAAADGTAEAAVLPSAPNANRTTSTWNTNPQPISWSMSARTAEPGGNRREDIKTPMRRRRIVVGVSACS